MSLLDEFERYESISWRDAKKGQGLVLKVVGEAPWTKKIQRTEFGDKNVLKFWPLRDGETQRRPMQNTFATVEILEGSDQWTTDERKGNTDPANPIGATMNWWVNLPSQALNVALVGANRELKKERGRGLGVGDVFKVTLADLQLPKGKDPKTSDLQKIFEVKYLAPKPSPRRTSSAKTNSATLTTETTF